MLVEFRLLGPFEVRADGGELIRFRRRQERTLLAVLLLEHGRAVTVDRLIDLLWAGDPAPRARQAVHSLISNIRVALRDARDVRLLTQGEAYLLRVSPESIDFQRFHVLVERARATDRPAQRSTELRAALELWRGQPLVDAATPAVRERLCVSMEELRFAALADRIDADLACGRHAELLAELSQLVVDHPLREQFHGQLIVALYRGGRRGDALDAYRHARQVLIAELGMEPGPMLRTLEQAILADDPTLAAAPTSAATESAPPVPAQLPADLPTFTGRVEELERLDDLLRHIGSPTAVVVTAIDGMAGIGKTALAVHFAHLVRKRFPDGQLVLDLHAHTEGHNPVEPLDALDRMLRILNVCVDRIPRDVEERAKLYRSMVAGKRILILLDNAASETQVRPLIPGAPGCLVLITSRRRLTGLDMVRPLSLEVLPAEDAAALFTQIARPEQVAADLVEDIVELCGRLPLAIQLAATRLRARPAWTAAHLAERLRDQQDRLAELEAGQRSVSAAFHLSYADLNPGQQFVFRRLGLHPGTDLDVYGATALTGGTIRQTGRFLETLLDAHLLQQHTPGRYQFHDLLRAYAGRTANEHEPEPERRAAIARLLDHYISATRVATDLLYPYATNRHPRPPRSEVPTPVLHDTKKAAAWLSAEHDNLLTAATYAADHGWPAHAIDLSAALSLHLRTRGHYTAAKSLHTRVLRAAHDTGNRAGEQRELCNLGHVHYRQDQYARALACHEQALSIARQIGDQGGELNALVGMVTVHVSQTRYQQAIDQALAIARQIGDSVSERLLTGIGIHEIQNRYDYALDCYEQALNIARQIGDRSTELDALRGLGTIHHLRGRDQQATEHLQQAFHLAHELDNRIGQLHTLCALGDAHHQQSRHQQALHYYQQALTIAHETGDRNGQFEALHGLGHTHLAADQPNQALTSQRAALNLAHELGQQLDEARAHDGIAQIHLNQHRHDRATTHWQQALHNFTQLHADHIHRAIRPQ